MLIPSNRRWRCPGQLAAICAVTPDTRLTLTTYGQDISAVLNSAGARISARWAMPSQHSNAVLLSLTCETGARTEHSGADVLLRTLIELLTIDVRDQHPQRWQPEPAAGMLAAYDSGLQIQLRMASNPSAVFWSIQNAARQHGVSAETHISTLPNSVHTIRLLDFTIAAAEGSFYLASDPDTQLAWRIDEAPPALGEQAHHMLIDALRASAHVLDLRTRRAA